MITQIRGLDVTDALAGYIKSAKNIMDMNARSKSRTYAQTVVVWDRLQNLPLLLAAHLQPNLMLQNLRVHLSSRREERLLVHHEAQVQTLHPYLPYLIHA